MTEEQSYFVASGDSHALKDDARASSRVERQDIDWAKTDIPEYAGAYAVVLDNVLAPAECAELVREAQARAASASGNGTGTGGDAWHGALLNGDVLDLATRKCLRIIWDSPQVVERLWRRIADSVPELQRVDAGSPVIMWGRGDTAHRMTRVNERMRFLKYGTGDYFKRHCDGSYRTPDGEEISLFTLHLYLNSSSRYSPESDLNGGATTFYARDRRRRVDVDPLAGRVLIFQHRGLIHAGDDVLSGTKITMRTDIMYRREAAEK